MLADPLFCNPNPNSLTSNSYTREDSQEITVLERQLLRIISLMSACMAALIQRNVSSRQARIAGMAC